MLEKGDHVKCFACNGALRDWEPKDDPWEEHARWFSHCNFIVAVKGKNYIKDIQSRHNVIESSLYYISNRVKFSD